MKFFQFRALDQRGAIVSGTIAATSHNDLKNRLDNRELSLLSCRLDWRASFSGSNVPHSRDLLTFTFHTQQLLSAGVPLLQALLDIKKTSSSPSLVATVDQLVESIDAGLCFSDACRQQPAVFNPLYCSLVEIGESSGRLGELLGELTELLKWQDETAANLRKVMIYPAFVAIVLLVVIVFVMSFLVPGLLSFITGTGAQIPWHTELLISCSKVIAAGWVWMLAVVVASAIVVRLVLARIPAARLYRDELLLRLPLIGVVLYRVKIARFARCAALMYSAGLGLPEVLKLGAAVVNCRAIGGDLLTARARVFDGQAITDALQDSGRFSALVISMIGVGETTGALDNAFRQISYFYDRETRDAIGRLEQSLGPCMIVVVGGIMLWVVVSVVGPIYDLVFSMQGI